VSRKRRRRNYRQAGGVYFSWRIDEPGGALDEWWCLGIIQGTLLRGWHGSTLVETSRLFIAVGIAS